jgi:hypothetical protein
MVPNIRSSKLRLAHLHDIHADLLRKMTVLARLRELVEQKEVALRSKRASHMRSTTTLPTKSGDPSGRHSQTGAIDLPPASS